MKSVNSITVLYNKILDPNYEADVDTTKSAYEISEVLSGGYSVDLLGIDTTEVHKIKNIKSDLVFNLLEWTGEYYIYEIQALKIMGHMAIPFTGSNARGYAIQANKKLMKNLFDKHHIPTPNWQVFENGDEKIKDLKFPLIVKPTLEHCGLGISQTSVVTNPIDLKLKIKEFLNVFKQPILVEEFIDGWEAHVTVFEKNGKPWVLPIARLDFDQSKNYLPILTYAGKWEEGSFESSLSHIKIATNLDQSLQKKIENAAVTVFRKLGGQDYSRLDIRINGDQIYVLEINNNPGIDFTDESGFGLSAREAGFNYQDALSHIVENAYLRFGKGAYDAAAA